MYTPHARYLRHRNEARLRHSRKFNAFLAAQSARLEESAFALMKAGATAAQVAAMPTPEPE